MEPSERPQEKRTPEEEARGKLRYRVKQYRIAIRWLRDAKHYKNTYASELTFEGKPWKDSAEGELAQDALKAYKEAVASVLYWRRLINDCNNTLMDLAKEKASARKRASSRQSR